MLAKFIKILITTLVNLEDGEAQKKYFNTYHQCVIFKSLIDWNFLLVFVSASLYLFVTIEFFLFYFNKNLKCTSLLCNLPHQIKSPISKLVVCSKIKCPDNSCEFECPVIRLSSRVTEFPAFLLAFSKQCFNVIKNVEIHSTVEPLKIWIEIPAFSFTAKCSRFQPTGCADFSH